MLTITIPASGTLWDERREMFIEVKAQTIQLEHSLVSLARWESKWHKAFLSKRPKTIEETIDYIRCMTVTKNVPDEAYYGLTQENIDAINRYIEDPMTATVFFKEEKTASSSETVTADLIYYWMISLGIPVEFEKWHLNRLLTLIKVFNVKNQKPKKMSKSATASYYASLNAARRQKLGTKG